MQLQALSVETPHNAQDEAQSMDLATAVRRKSIRMLEISSPLPSGVTSSAVSLALRAQAEGDLVAWIQDPSLVVFPPDLAACGIDLNALTVIQLGAAHSAQNCLRAAEWLLRSGGFGLVVADLRACDTSRAPVAWQNRLYPIAERYDACLCLLTASALTQASFGPLVHLRLEPRRIAGDAEHEVIQYQIRKDKIGLRTCSDLRVTLPKGAQSSLFNEEFASRRKVS